MCIIMAVQASDNDVQVKPPIVVLVQTELPKHDTFCKLRLYTTLHFLHNLQKDR
jgi:hypothetical protein